MNKKIYPLTNCNILKKLLEEELHISVSYAIDIDNDIITFRLYDRTQNINYCYKIEAFYLLSDILLPTVYNKIVALYYEMRK